MTRRDKLVQDLLGDDEAPRDHSLRGKSLARATEAQVPKTLTPDEWADWYSEHGVPESHRRSAPAVSENRSMRVRLREWLQRLRDRS